MLDRLAGIKRRYEEIGEQMTDPASMADMKKFVQLNKDYKELEPIAQVYETYKNIVENIESSREILKTEKDEEFRDMAREELEDLIAQKEQLEDDIKTLLIPKDPQDAKNAILEIRAGTGGDEASIFAGDLFRMYSKYCETKGWKFDIVDMTEGTVGGYKEIIVNVSGKDVYGTLKYESGVHRVQRVPQTETQGRVHTSAATVAVLPEAEEFDIELNPADIRKDTYCSSGPGGQSVNTTYSAIRLTHAPTGIVVTCQDEKSQLKNLDKAMKVLRSRIYELEYAKYMDEISSKRKTMVSSGDRSAKIRTYNYPQGRVTDHRISLTLYNLTSIVNGDIQEIIDKLQIAENYERLKEQEENL
ncbi:MAG: peptide chain release factor 1 [Bacteroidales bacterium]|nr:peptide chain release factor 1 [Bacteroidales bacterium]